MSVLEITAHGKRLRMHNTETEVGPPKGRIARCWAAGIPYERALLEHIYEQGFQGTAVDVGANVGNHALWLATVCGLDVVAFEPLTLGELEANVALNGLGVRIEPVALGAAEGVARVVAAKGQLTADGGTIPVRPLDLYELSDVALLKIDVEGMEPEVLRGGEETIRRDRPAIFAEAQTQADHDALAEVLEPWGYALTERFASRSVATPVERWDTC